MRGHVRPWKHGVRTSDRRLVAAMVLGTVGSTRAARRAKRKCSSRVWSGESRVQRSQETAMCMQMRSFAAMPRTLASDCPDEHGQEEVPTSASRAQLAGRRRSPEAAGGVKRRR